MMHRETKHRAILQCKLRQHKDQFCGDDRTDDLWRARTAYGSGAIILVALTNAADFTDKARRRARMIRIPNGRKRLDKRRVAHRVIVLQIPHSGIHRERHHRHGTAAARILTLKQSDKLMADISAKGVPRCPTGKQESI